MSIFQHKNTFYNLNNIKKIIKIEFKKGETFNHNLTSRVISEDLFCLQIVYTGDSRDEYASNLFLGDSNNDLIPFTTETAREDFINRYINADL